LRALSRLRHPFVVIRVELLLIYSVILLVLVLQVGLGLSYDRILRAFNGVARGVVFEGSDVSGRFRAELYGVVERYAEESGLQLVEAMAGIEPASAISDGAISAVDVEATVQRILKAKPGDRVSAVTVVQAPRLDPRTAAEIRRVETNQQAVAFAVNVAWGDEYLEPMLDLFDRGGARASFFFVGTWARERPDLVKRIAEAGHEVANHGYEHIHVSSVGADRIKKLIQDNQRLLYSITGQQTRLFGPPYGEVNSSIVRAAAEVGHYTTMWDVDTIDWQLPEPSVIVNRVISKIRPGSIVLMHPTAPTVQALPEVLAELARMGYRVVSVSDLIGVAM
jgi:peptidoglycan/xylan/chitin deacetylase (PgdA/CDA1 family)